MGRLDQGAVAPGRRTRVGVGQMVQHAGADDVLEALTEFGGTLHGELAHLEVGERVLLLQPLREREALGADIDPDDLGAGPAQSIVGGLGSAAARDQYAAVVAVRLGRPEEMRVGASAPIVPGLTVRLQVIHRRRVGVIFVKFADLPGDGAGSRRGIFIVVHDRQEPFPTKLSQLGTGEKTLPQT